jgi:oligopeptide/dipeptide ABC transporter ATP-binding protein
MTPLVSVDGLTVELPVGGELRTVLRDVTFSVAEGTSTALVGESGSGKSMTVRAISRLLPDGAALTGRIRVGAHDVLDLRPAALRRYRASEVAMIFQDPRAHTNPLRRIGDFLTEAMVINDRLPRRKAVARAEELLHEVGIHDAERRMRQYPHELSGGLLQRVMIASAVASRPRLVLADEPTTALDVTTQAEVLRVLIRMQQEHGMAMLFITHDLDLAASFCDETVVLYAGEVVERQAAGRPHDTPLHPYTAALRRARPDIGVRAPRLAAIPGHPTTAYAAPPGCSFAPRCAFAQDPCREHKPALLTMGADGASRCLYADELRGRLADDHVDPAARAAIEEVPS